MSKPFVRTLFLWIVLFVITSFVHAYLFHVHLNSLEGFYSPFRDVILVGIVLSLLALSLSSLLFFPCVVLIKRTSKIRTNLIKLNAVLISVFIITLIFGISLTASFYEGLIFVGSYFVPLMAVLNDYYFRVERTPTR